MLDLRWTWWAFVLGGAMGCKRSDAVFSTAFASDFTPARHSVSVFGVYEEGRMSSSAWDLFSARMTRALGAARCEVGYEALGRANGDVTQAIDDVSRADGPTDDLLAQIAPAAKGDMLLLVNLSGKLPEPTGDGRHWEPTGPDPWAMQSRRSSQRLGSPTRSTVRGAPPGEATTEAGVEISASLFSVAQARSVAMVTLDYTGSNLDDAIGRLAEKLRSAFPDMACVGWNLEAKIDPAAVRARLEQ